MRILQLIDSLDAGGAERMAVNYANILADEISFSGLVTTRKEGALKDELSNKVTYLFLNKKSKWDIKAILKLRNFINQNKITIIHAHSTSFFTAVMVKIMIPNLKIIWHDHHGNRIKKKDSMNGMLQIGSVFFNGVITVNEELKQWSKTHLVTKEVIFFPNFVLTITKESSVKTVLKGQKGKRIIFLANLKEPKNHLQILESYVKSDAQSLGWTLHLVGKDFFNEYSEELKKFIKKHNLHNFIFIYNSCNDVENILNQSNVGILGSTYEGFPVTLLEYGKAKLAVISTNVGYCSTLITDKENGLLFSPHESSEIISKINAMVENENNRLKYANVFHQQVMENYSDKAVIKEYLKWLEKI